MIEPFVKVPEHLSPEATAIWDRTVADFMLEPHDLERLRVALEAWDRTQQARKILDAEGLTFTDKHGQPRARPEVQVEKDNRTSFVRIWRELGLDRSEVEESRPPSITGRANLRLG